MLVTLYFFPCLHQSRMFDTNMVYNSPVFKDVHKFSIWICLFSFHLSLLIFPSTCNPERSKKSWALYDRCFKQKVRGSHHFRFMTLLHLLGSISTFDALLLMMGVYSDFFVDLPTGFELFYRLFFISIGDSSDNGIYQG